MCAEMRSSRRRGGAWCVMTGRVMAGRGRGACVCGDAHLDAPQRRLVRFSCRRRCCSRGVQPVETLALQWAREGRVCVRRCAPRGAAECCSRGMQPVETLALLTRCWCRLDAARRVQYIISPNPPMFTSPPPPEIRAGPSPAGAGRRAGPLLRPGYARCYKYTYTCYIYTYYILHITYYILYYLGGDKDDARCYTYTCTYFVYIYYVINIILYGW